MFVLILRSEPPEHSSRNVTSLHSSSLSELTNAVRLPCRGSKVDAHCMVVAAAAVAVVLAALEVLAVVAVVVMVLLLMLVTVVGRRQWPCWCG